MKGTNIATKKINSLRICQMKNEMLGDVSHVHMQAFKGAMNTRLGLTYVREFLAWFIRLEGGVSLVAIMGSRESEQVVGYLVGAPLDYGKEMNRDLFWIAGWNTMIRPWLFLSHQFRETIKGRLSTLFKPAQNALSQVDLPTPAMSVVGLAVLPNFQGQNIGKELLRAFEKRARELHVRSLRLSVYPENSAARRAYENCGWVPSEGSVSSGKTLYYYRYL